MNEKKKNNRYQHRYKRRNPPDPEEDRISQLPEVLLHHILSFMPLKSAIRTSILSRRWKDIWKGFWAYTTSLDFDEEFFSSFDNYDFAVNAIDRYLPLHRSKNIESFRLYLYECCDDDQPHLNRWIEFAIKRRVRELDLYLPILDGCYKLPARLFTCNHSLTILKLVWCKLEEEKLEGMLLKCHVLEKLTLSDCYFDQLKLSSQLLKFKCLTLSSSSGLFPKFEICLPNLLSFHFCGFLKNTDLFMNLLSLEDAIVIMPKYFDPAVGVCQARVLPAIMHVEILTTCNFSLFNFVRAITDEKREKLPTVFPNLRELQLLLSLHDDYNQKVVYIFFKHFTLPCLEELFIELDSWKPWIHYLRGQLSEEYAAELGPAESLFCHLKKIKINGFSGFEFELQFVKFLLEKALILEKLVLVTPERHTDHCSAIKASTSQTEPNESSKLSLLHQQLLLLPKASLNAQIILYEYPKDDKNLRPRHATQAGDLLHFKDMGFI